MVGNKDYLNKENTRRAKQYITEIKKHGYSNDVIMNELLKAGYDKKTVNNAFAYLSTRRLINFVLGTVFFLCIIIAIFSALKLFGIL